MNLGRCLLACVAIFGCVSLVRAEVPPRSVEDLQKTASHIVTGKVVKVTGTDQKGAGAGYVDVAYVIEVKVLEVKKGKGMAVGDVVLAKAWKAKERPKGWTGPSGQYEIPKEGQTVKLYLEGENGEYTAISPNGIQKVE